MRRRYRSMGYVYQRASGLYELRYPIPKALQPYFLKPNGNGFRPHVIESLGTRDVGQANARAQERIRTLQALFEYLEGEDLTDALRQPLKAEFEAILAEDLEGRLRDDSGALADELFVRPLVNALDSSDPEELRAVAGYLVEPALDALTVPGLAIPDDTPVYGRVLQLCADVLLDAHRIRLARAKSLPEPSTRSVILAPEPMRDPADGLALSREGKKSVADYWDVYETRTAAKQLQQHTMNRRRKAWERLCASVGPKTPLWRVRKAHIWTLAEELAGFPARAGSQPELKGLNYRELLAYAKANPDKVALREQGTIDTDLRDVCGVFQHAVDRADLDRNPAEGVTATAMVASKDRRDQFTIEELNLLFNHPIFHQNLPPEKRDDLYWVPLLELFTGARASELYLRTADLFPDHDVPHIRIVAYDQRTLKNNSSERSIPLHPVLLDLGFRQKCQAAIESERQLLFPEWVVPAGKKPSEVYRRTKKFRTMLIQAGVTRKNVTSHSFRHNFETAMVEAGIPENQARRLTGRAIPGSAGGYIKELSLPSLQGAISKIRYDGLIIPGA